jgi:hypothetical protein
MSSRLFLVFAKHMDNEGAFKKAARRGHYTTEQMMAACTANELMSIRYARLGGDEPVFFQSDGVLADEAAADNDGMSEFDEDEFNEFLNGGFAAMYCGDSEDEV